MKATSKQEFFELLGYELNRIGIEDTSEIFVDFEEHFSDGFIRGIPENEIAEGLGDIKEIARSYLNLESSRLNSIMARDIERNKISLTKPGRSVPADLSLVKDGNPASQDIKDIMNSDNIRSYTPEHLSEEIYPQAPTSTPSFGRSVSQGTSASQGTNASQSAAGSAAASAKEKSVADAFSEAGKAAVDAAKVAGHAIADAFSQNNVKSKMSEAKKTAAAAVKTAGKSAADAINKAKSEHEQKHGKAKSGAATQAREVYPGTAAAASAGVNNGKSKKSEKNRKPFSRISDFKGMKTDINSEKLAVAIVLDVFLWSWLLPVIAGLLIAMFFGGLNVMFEEGFGAFRDHSYYYISKLFLFTGFCSLGAIICLFAVWLIKQFLKLIKYIIILHYKAVYNV